MLYSTMALPLTPNDGRVLIVVVLADAEMAMHTDPKNPKALLMAGVGVEG